MQLTSLPSQECSRAIKEAISLAPNNPDVKEAFDKISKDDQQHQSVLYLCRRFISERDQNAGREAVRYLKRSASLPSETAKECMEVVIGSEDAIDQAIRNDILAGLLREAPAAKKFLAKRLQESRDNALFEDVYNLGSGGANGIVTVVLDASIWASEAEKEACEREMFQYFLAKLLEVGDEHEGRAVKGIARLLSVDAEKLQDLIDDECFDAILTCLDERNPVEVRTQATLATAKYLEASGDRGQKALTNFVVVRVAKQTNEDLVLAFSAAAGVFPVAPSIAAALFLTQGFLEGLIPLVEKKAKSSKVEKATLIMLNAACIDTACRDAIRKACTKWLQQIHEKAKVSDSSSAADIAAVILAKLQDPSSASNGTEKFNSQSASDLVADLEKLMSNEDAGRRQSSIEGLAYSSVNPQVKQRLAQGSSLRELQKVLATSRPGSSLAFGGLTIIDNLTRYLPNLSEEQKRISQLKAYANASKPTVQVDPLDEDAAVTGRCKAVVSAGTVSTLVSISKTLSPASISILFNIILSLSRTASLRGTIAQQGGARLLLQNYTLITGTSDTEVKARYTAAHALARMLISVDPALAFTGSLSLTSAIRPLLSLLTENSESHSQSPRDLLPTFESLLALTNLASVPASDVAETIIRVAFPTIEELLLSNNTLIRRATTELVCNLVNCAAGVELFANGSGDAERRVHILLAMADVDDPQTRQAAGGALAMITQFDGTVAAILARERGVEIILGLAEDGSEEIVHRGVVCVMQLVCVEDAATRQEAQLTVLGQGGDRILAAGCEKYSRNEGILEYAVQALKALESS